MLNNIVAWMGLEKSVQIPELVWIGVVGATLWIKAINVRDAYNDLKILKENGLNHFREVVAKSILYTDLTQAFITLLFLGIGVEALSEDPHDLQDFGYFFFAGSLFAAVFIMLWTAWYSRLTRKRLVQMWKEAQDEIEAAKKKVEDAETKEVALASQTRHDAMDAKGKSDKALKKARKKNSGKRGSPEA